MSKPICTTPTPSGVCLPCPACGEPSACFAIHLAALDDANAFKCLECDTEFSFDHMRNVVNLWQVVLEGVSAMAGMLRTLDTLDEAEEQESVG